MSYESQLKLLLDNLKKNNKLRHNSPKLDEKIESGLSDGSGEVRNEQLPIPSLNINSAHNLINEVIMHPSIMWNRQFFYSLNSMPLSEQNLMKEWFSEMNEVSSLQIY